MMFQGLQGRVLVLFPSPPSPCHLEESGKPWPSESLRTLDLLLRSKHQNQMMAHRWSGYGQPEHVLSKTGVVGLPQPTYSIAPLHHFPWLVRKLVGLPQLTYSIAPLLLFPWLFRQCSCHGCCCCLLLHHLPWLDLREWRLQHPGTSSPRRRMWVSSECPWRRSQGARVDVVWDWAGVRFNHAHSESHTKQTQRHTVKNTRHPTPVRDTPDKDTKGDTDIKRLFMFSTFKF